MARWAFFLAVTLLVVTGCGQSVPSTPTEQGAAYVRAGRYDDAIASYTEAIRQSPHDAESYLVRGRAHHCRNRAGDLDQAIADFTQAIQIAPQDPEAYYSRSLAYRDQGDAEKSQEDESTARRLDPRVSETYAQLPDVGPKAVTPDSHPVDSSAPNSEVDTLYGTKTTQPAKDDDFLSHNRPELEVDPLAAEKKQRKDLEDRDALEVRRAREAVARKKRPVAGGAGQRDEDSLARPSGSAASKAAPRRSRDDSLYSPSEPRYASPPTSPWAPRGAISGNVERGNPYQTPSSPFPQRAPRPTGFVEDPGTGPFRSPPRGVSSNPYSIPTNRLPGALHDDLNP